MTQAAKQKIFSREIEIRTDSVGLSGELTIPGGATGIVLFAHGSGSSRFSPRNKHVAKVLQNAGLGTLLFDLLTANEEAVDAYTRHLRFDIGLLAQRLVAAAEWLQNYEEARSLKVGFFGSSTGGAAALVAAALLGEKVGAVVSRGGRPDLAGAALEKVTPPVLLIVGGYDDIVIQLNEQAYERLKCEKTLKIVAGASHLFEEPGTLEAVAQLAADWFARYLK